MERFPQEPLELAENVFWVGSWIEDDNFQCHTYLLKEGKESVLIDPGSLITYPKTIKKIKKLIDPKDVKYFVCHHQDPDITACISQYEKEFPRKDRFVLTHWRTKELLKHYKWKAKFYLVDEHNWELKLPSGKLLKFIFTPYAHFAGNICTYDPKTKILFSSDIFGGLVSKQTLFVEEENFFEDIKIFHEHYMPSREILLFALEKIKKLDLELIAPQHGYIIPKKFIPLFIEKLSKIDCGIFCHFIEENRDLYFISKLNEIVDRLYVEILIRKRSLEEILKYIYKEIALFSPLVHLLVWVLTHNEIIVWSANRRERTIFPADNDIKDWTKRIKYTFKNKKCLKIRFSNIKKICKELKPEKNKIFLFPILIERDFKGFLLLEFDKSFNKLCSNLENFFLKLKDLLKYCLEQELKILEFQKEQQKLYNLAIKDSLTGAYNRFYLNVKIKELEKEIKRYNISLSIMMMDIDYFKKVNDMYGHFVGDEVLKKLVELIKANLRETDIIVRYGGEEFIILLPYTTIFKACEVANRLRRKIEETVFEVGDHKIKITVSIGVISVNAKKLKKNPLEIFIKKVDVLLYKAKNQGRNQVICEKS